MTAPASRTSPNAHPTLLRIPAWYSPKAHEEVLLPQPPEDYDVRQVGDRWQVTIGGTTELIYDGIGPVEVIRSAAPF